MDNPTLITELSLKASELRLSDANEATTRFKLIDQVIFELLGWEKQQVEVEERVQEDGNTTFCDYKIAIGGKSFLIEAKKIGVQFKRLPASRKAVLGSSWATRGEVGKAIQQARDYARTLGVGFCVVTNGLSWIIFPVNRRDQVPFEQSLAVIFKELSYSDEVEVEELKSLLSKASVIEDSLEQELLGDSKDQIDKRRLNSIYDRSFAKVNRESIFPLIEREIITAFNESLLSDSPELLKKCYVSTPERTRFDTRIGMYLKPREQVLKTRPIRPVGRKKDKTIITNYIKEDRLSQRPIILLTLGLVGAGKTTFLSYVQHVTSNRKFEVTKSVPNGCWIHIDFRDFSLTGSANEFLIKQIFRYVSTHPFINNYQKSLSKIYYEEIQLLKEGPFAPVADNEEKFNELAAELIARDFREKAPYVEKVISYYSKEIPIFLVVDNVDQIENPDKQSEIFLEATALARSYGCNLVLAMRDGTYVKHRTSAVFDAFDFDAVYIDPPEIKAVLSKRFTVAAQLLEGKTVTFTGENGATVKVENARIIIDMLSESVLGTEVGRILDVAATGDTRLALRMTRQFLQFGYSSTGKAIGVYQRTGRYTLPPHEALRAIMLGNQNVYKEDFSVIGNPFDAHLGRSDIQFLRIHLMSVMVANSADREFDGTRVGDICGCYEQIGISRRDTMTVIKDLIEFRYVFTKSHQPLSEESIILASRLCGFVVKDLAGKLMFIETVMFDTFIQDNNTWSSIDGSMKSIYRERDPVKKFGMRREVVKLFFQFCERGVERISEMSRKAGLPPQWCVNPVKSVSREFYSDLTRASRSAMNTYGKRNDRDVTHLPLFK